MISLPKKITNLEADRHQSGPSNGVIGEVWTKLLIIFWMAMIFSPSVFAQNEDKPSWWSQETVTGDWGGLRSRLSDKGVDFEFVYTGDVMSNISGGIQRQTDYLDAIDLVLSIDAEKLLNWKGASFNFYGAGFQGGSPSANSGDAQGPSNIEADDAWKLLEAWYQQKLFNEKFSILLGLYDVNSEFDGMETASLFLNSSQGMGVDFSQSGLNGPSAWPNTALAVRARLELQKWFYLQVAVVDGVAGDPAHPHSTRIRWDSSEGFLITSEIGFLPGEMKDDAPYGKFALGSWIYTSEFDDVADVDGLGSPVRRSGNFGIYALGEYTVFREKDDPDQGLAVYGRFGYANPSINPISYYIGAGAVYTGLIPKRNQDKLGVAVATAINGSKFVNGQQAAGTPVKRSETNIEVSYKAQLTPWLAVQPDVQYIMNPGMDPSRGHALQVGARFEVLF